MRIDSHSWPIEAVRHSDPRRHVSTEAVLMNYDAALSKAKSKRVVQYVFFWALSRLLSYFWLQQSPYSDMKFWKVSHNMPNAIRSCLDNKKCIVPFASPRNGEFPRCLFAEYCHWSANRRRGHISSLLIGD
ncbi:hypothetical protein J3459_015885 [Metarhizium acridum]|nr:hypothetical protein J3459_015885 [Metarhizium acridum]